MKFELGYNPSLVGWLCDPPTGWAYGFPKLFIPNVGESLGDWLVRQGYPEKDRELGEKYSRFIEPQRVLE